MFVIVLAPHVIAMKLMIGTLVCTVSHDCFSLMFE